MSLKTMQSIIKKFTPAKIIDSLFAVKNTMAVWPYSTSVVSTLNFFAAFRKNPMHREPLAWFTYQGMHFGLRPMEWYAMESIILGREYEPIQHLFSGRSPKTIVDAGANIGLFSIYALSLWPQARILSIEASPETCAVLEQNRGKNPGYTWHAENYALWSEDGHVHFKDEGFSYGRHISKETAGIRVPSVRLDSFMEKHIPGEDMVSLMKLDIEGAEETVLLSSQHVLSRVETVLVEVHPPMSNTDVVADILKKNFQYVYDISTPGDIHDFVLFLACREPLPEEKFSPLS